MGYYGYKNRVSIEALVGKTLVEVVGDVGDEIIIFKVDDGSEYHMLHEQDCCESVNIEDIVGNVNDLVGSPILYADESSNSDDPPAAGYVGYIPDSYTWTFYSLSTIKGTVTIRWYGESNGYYSESVDVYCIPAKN